MWINTSTKKRQIHTLYYRMLHLLTGGEEDEV